MPAVSSAVFTAIALATAATATAAVAVPAAKRTISGMGSAAGAARDAADAQKRDAAKLASDAESRRANEEGSAAATATAQAARARQKSVAAGAQGQRSTILTGPLGITGDTAAAPRKTILGA